MPAARLEHIPFSGIREVSGECRRLEVDDVPAVGLEA